MFYLLKYFSISLFILVFQTEVYADFTVTEIAKGLYVHYGLQAETSVANKGDIANIGFIVGKKCVAVIDTGGSLTVGNALRHTIQQTTTIPICYVINTHIHPDHIFGNRAFLADKPVYLAHVHFPRALASRATNYLTAFSLLLAESLAENILVYPDKTVDDALELDLGERIIRLQTYPTAHTDNDLSVYDVNTDTLWLADLLFVERIPVIDGSLLGWVSVLEKLQQQNFKHVIAGHGEIKQIDWHPAMATELRYLTTIRDEVREYIKQMKPIEDAVAQVGHTEQARWLLFDDYHKRNVTAAFAELEWE
ncbi:quinoprotein relay system zinc metallohydrolase 2 [Beggiatoa leptomitoformis]|uniref:Quinoprotein relay system zinc metallohydrolase 2 n=1 Tax=Beggiatoa leptomitoformis TaxID=288004 RepID=A0A2N9YA57_9GAMM|nr:quinoprotein relay system zinc metallohydrolase 2 [Beggiatoa leptomitoformis]ALG69344.2 quinoprotein relay system zinc metallohydrolase 2 [Beggiatoa leptomitoformis]AUI67346.1 quinoprotein relay system zinc metallohydrolase 2 [Beggiatoa leptomitoformis]